MRDGEVNILHIGVAEMVVIFIVALFAIGPDRLPSYARKLGEALAQFRKYSEEATRDIKESIVEPLEEAQRPLREAIEPIEELDKTVRGNIKDVQKSFADIGKTKKAPKTEEPADAEGNVPEPEDSEVHEESGETVSKPAEPKEAAETVEETETPPAKQSAKEIEYYI